MRPADKQLKMLSYVDYVLAVGLYPTGTKGTEATDTADRMCEAIQVSLQTIEHVAGIALRVCVNLKLARCDEALASLFFVSDTKAQLHSLPLDHKELFGGKLDDASKQAEVRGCRQLELEVAFKVPQAQIQANSAPAPTYSFHVSSQCTSQLGCGRGKDKSKKGKGRGCG